MRTQLAVRTNVAIKIYIHKKSAMGQIESTDSEEEGGDNSKGSWTSDDSPESMALRSLPTVSLATLAFKADINDGFQDWFQCSMQQVVEGQWDKSLAGHPVVISPQIKNWGTHFMGICVASADVLSEVTGNKKKYHAVYIFDVTQAPDPSLKGHTVHACKCAFGYLCAVKDDLVHPKRAIICSRFVSSGIAFARVISFDKGPYEGVRPTGRDTHNDRRYYAKARIEVSDIIWDDIIAGNGPRAIDARTNMFSDIERTPTQPLFNRTEKR